MPHVGCQAGFVSETDMQAAVLYGSNYEAMCCDSQAAEIIFQDNELVSTWAGSSCLPNSQVQTECNALCWRKSYIIEIANKIDIIPVDFSAHGLDPQYGQVGH